MASPPPARGRRSRKPSEKAIEVAALNISDILDADEAKQARRSQRKRISTHRGEEYQKDTKKVVAEPEGLPIGAFYQENSDDEDVERAAETKPTELFAENGKDVHGTELFGFKTPKKNRRTTGGATAITPKSGGAKSASKATKTPSHVRTQIKKSK